MILGGPWAKLVHFHSEVFGLEQLSLVSSWILLFRTGLNKGGMANRKGLKNHFKHSINGMKVTEVKQALMEFDAFLLLKVKELREV